MGESLAPLAPQAPEVRGRRLRSRAAGGPRRAAASARGGWACRGAGERPRGGSSCGTMRAAESRSRELLSGLRSSI